MDPVDAPLAAEDAPRYPAPVSARRALAIVELLEVPPGGSVLDLGAGPAGLLLDVVALCACHGVGLVGSETLAAGARAVAEREGLGERIEFRATSALAFAPPRRLDAVLGLGGLGRPAESLEDAAGRCLGWLRTGGVFVYGEAFLRRAPVPAYRALLGAAGEGLRMPGVSARAIVAAGFELMLTAVLSESEWDAHESAAYRASLRRAALDPDDAAAAARRERAERWYQGYWRHGRDTLGYALHAFRKPRLALHVV
ncbi:MAG TPA: class I SAM-dependent methyltransferase [Steroidobacteraceae bacterium]|nr:class I SAM-dependent methyltransferase [Steroidobacteraceae bacterium]